jgi:hypothetical protein
MGELKKKHRITRIGDRELRNRKKSRKIYEKIVGP